MHSVKEYNLMYILVLTIVCGFLMGFISVLAALLLFIVSLVMCIGLINPKWLKNPKKPDEIMKRSELLGGGLLAIVVLTFITVVTSPEPSSNVQNANNVKAEVNSENLVSNNIKFDYDIISDEKMRTIKRSVNVELPERLSKEQLEQLAYEIKNLDKNEYERTFILYRIKGEKSDAAWATTHFNPNLEVKFIGL
ncbi:hypothetical protein MMO38_00320 [Acinetobacter sp. NIPH 1852]|uniref:hypothetical protein n=1 Tax=Acinetobacter sp. NIPH 1852 TaxID=2923428 RepID=UPI001F4A934F|nr:hypothetical protein [Acinetobacter sp. NIPH 1852]MCH7306591.1 hypothetical protein [Acinetobacter sp. NIPH 1852]